MKQPDLCPLNIADAGLRVMNLASIVPNGDITSKKDGIRFKNTHLIRWDAETDVDFMASEVIKLLKRIEVGP
jgi:hypothetical protein